jgi:putative endonuclease
MDPRIALGKRAEAAACEFLIKKGFCLLERNYRSHFGEIDLIMQDQDDIVFVEVRSRSRIDYGRAATSVNKEKQRKLAKTATRYLQMKKWLYKKYSRFDVIAIHWIDNNLQIEWFKNAFYGNG